MNQLSNEPNPIAETLSMTFEISPTTFGMLYIGDLFIFRNENGELPEHNRIGVQQKTSARQHREITGLGGCQHLSKGYTVYALKYKSAKIVKPSTEN